MNSLLERFCFTLASSRSSSWYDLPLKSAVSPMLHNSHDRECQSTLRVTAIARAGFDCNLLRLTATGLELHLWSADHPFLSPETLPALPNHAAGIKWHVARVLTEDGRSWPTWFWAAVCAKLLGAEGPQ